MNHMKSNDLISRIVQGEEIQAKCQAPRKWMIKGREKLGLSRIELGKSVGCSEKLIEMLEDGATITHPNIAARIAHKLGGTVRQYNQIVHRMHRVKELPEVEKIKPNEDAMVRECPQCKRKFLAKSNTQRYCGVVCANTSRRKSGQEEG